MGKEGRTRKNIFLWVTEEWLIILITILLLLAIAIGAASARTLSPTKSGVGTKATITQQPLSTNFGDDEIE